MKKTCIHTQPIHLCLTKPKGYLTKYEETVTISIISRYVFTNTGQIKQRRKEEI